MSETLIGTLWGGVVVLVGSLLTWWVNRGKHRSDASLSQAQLDEQRRREDINIIINTLQDQVEDLQAEVRAVKVENRECLADRDQMRGELRRLMGIDREKTDEIQLLRDRVAKLERGD